MGRRWFRTQDPLHKEAKSSRQPAIPDLLDEYDLSLLREAFLYSFDSWCILYLGDSVYVRSDEEYPYMAKNDKMWTDAR